MRARVCRRAGLISFFTTVETSPRRGESTLVIHHERRVPSIFRRIRPSLDATPSSRRDPRVAPTHTRRHSRARDRRETPTDRRDARAIVFAPTLPVLAREIIARRRRRRVIVVDDVIIHDVDDDSRTRARRRLQTSRGGRPGRGHRSHARGARARQDDVVARRGEENRGTTSLGGDGVRRVGAGNRQRTVRAGGRGGDAVE